MTAAQQHSGKVVLGINILYFDDKTTTKYAAAEDTTPEQKWEACMALDNFMRQWCPEWNDSMVELDSLVQKGMAAEDREENSLWRRLRRP